MFRQILPAANVFSISLTGGVGAGSASDGGSAWTWLIPTMQLRTRADKTQVDTNAVVRLLRAKRPCTPPITACVQIFATSLLVENRGGLRRLSGSIERATVADGDGHDSAVS